jgi:response regulator of citrate/malate metabolism
MGSEEIKKKIIRYLEAQKYPATTEEIAKGAGISWNTAELYLTRLQAVDKVGFRRAGRQNQWWRIKEISNIVEGLQSVRKRVKFGTGDL